MEKRMEWEIKILRNELEQGRELTKQLKNHLNPSLPTPEKRQFLIQRILASYENALSMLNWSASTTDSNIFLNLSPTSPSSRTSEGYTLDSKGTLSKKRKALPKWNEKEMVCLENGQEGHYDGYSWRKYGQKDILGANHPRAYYRCTHQQTQGCLAKKHVQKADKDPTILEISYRGTHTCIQASHFIRKIAPQEKQEPTQNKKQKMIINYGPNLKVENDVLDPTFHCPSTTSIEGLGLGSIEGLGLGSIESLGSTFMDGPNNFMDNFTLASISPATSESNYFSIWPLYHSTDSFGMEENVHPYEFDLNDILNTNFSFGDSDLDSMFQFDNSD